MYRQTFFIARLLSVYCQCVVRIVASAFKKLACFFSVLVKILIHILYKCTKIHIFLLLSCEASVKPVYVQLVVRSDIKLVTHWF